LQSRFLAYLLEFSHYWGKGIRTLLGFGLVQVRKQTEMPAMALKKPVKP
jgi:CRISPR/Cas system endoribonuclease Cas6 (RAMP superfamily)